MRGPTCATPAASDFTPAGSTIDTPASTHAVSEESYPGDTILPSIELSGQQPSINKVNASFVPPSERATASAVLSQTLSNDHSSGPPSQSTQSGVSSVKNYEAPFNFRSLYNATPASTPGLSERPSEPLTIPEKEAASGQLKQSQACAQRLSAKFQRLDIDQSSILGHISAYDVKDEIPPSEPYFDAAFQAALKKGLRLAGRIAACLQQCDLAQKVDSDLHKLYRTATELESFESPATRTIGIVGDSATGIAHLKETIGILLRTSVS